MKTRFEPENDEDASRFEELLDCVAHVFSVPKEGILSDSKLSMYCTPRHLLATIWSETHSLQDTGWRIGKRHHGTIMHSRERVQYLVEHDPKFADAAQTVLDLINENLEETENLS